MSASHDGNGGPITSAIRKCQRSFRFARHTIKDTLRAVDRIFIRASRGLRSLDKIKNSFEFHEDTHDDTSDNEGELDSDGVIYDAGADPIPEDTSLQDLLHDDLEIAKEAGFHAGFLGKATGSIVVSLSCPVSQLGLSWQALIGWEIEASHHLVLLIFFPNTYQSLEQILTRSVNTLAGIEMRVGICDRPFACPDVVRKMFQARELYKNDEEAQSKMKDRPTFKDMLISKSLHHVLNKRFLAVASLRGDYNLSWTGAELFFHEMQGKVIQVKDLKKYWTSDGWSTSVPDLLNCDHFAETGARINLMSLPLLAMQYTLRHFVRYADFCLVCHCKTFEKFQSLKPYVCSRELCVSQYMQLGKGSSVESEILSQPMVVDLLVSLAYASAFGQRLEDFPDGLRLSLRVPPLANEARAYPGGEIRNYNVPHKAILDTQTFTLSGNNAKNINPGDWILIFHEESSAVWHFQAVHNARDSYQVKLVKPLYLMERPCGLDGLDRSRLRVKFSIYDQDFNTLNFHQKQASVVCLLNTLPSIAGIAKTLGESPSNSLSPNMNLSMGEMASPAALLLLRWIIQSNRSYIVLEPEGSYYKRPDGTSLLKFRFLQRAPDKEHQFRRAVKKHAAGLNPQTITGWHGSSILNWHNILREGLHFQYTAHGRALGDGVYLSQDFKCSLKYSGPQNPQGAYSWPGSCLNIKYVISLNEVVNCPKKFVCSNGTTCVVQFLDWIQTRYLYVGSGVSQPNGKTKSHSASKSKKPKYPPSLLHTIPSRVIIDLVDEDNEEKTAAERTAKIARKTQISELDAIWNSFQD